MLVAGNMSCLSVFAPCESGAGFSFDLVKPRDNIVRDMRERSRLVVIVRGRIHVYSALKNTTPIWGAALSHRLVMIYIWGEVFHPERNER